jgi:hypothetical protein
MKRILSFKIFFTIILIASNAIFLLHISNVGAFSKSVLDVNASPAPCITVTPSKTQYNLNYHCGDVMYGTITVHPIYWFPDDTENLTYINLMNRYYNDVATTTGGQNFFNILTQYADKNGNAPVAESFDSTSGYWIDTTDTYPGTQLTDQDLYNEVQNALNNNSGWSPTTGLSVYYPIYFAAGECYGNNCTGNGSATHVNLGGQGSSSIIAGVLPYGVGQSLLGGSPNNFPAADEAITTSAHEEFEAITDPDGPSKEGAGTGWYGYYVMPGPEIADQCQGPVPSGYGSTWGTVASDGSNHVWNSDKYIIQNMWDNGEIGTNGCYKTPDN